MRGNLKKGIICFVPMLIMLFFACTKDVFEGEEPKNPDPGDNSEIPGDFDFSTVKSTKVTVNVSDLFQDQYYLVVEIYDANPFSSDGANLLAKGVAKKDAPYVVELVFPQILETLYVKQIDPLQRASVQVCDATSDAINCTFDTSATIKSYSAPELRDGTVLSASDYPLPNDYTDLSGVSNNYQLMSGNYYVPEGVTLNGGSLKSYWAGNSSLYVAGTVTLTNWYMANNDKIVVLPGGKVIVKSVSGGVIGQSNTVVAVHGASESKSAGSIEFTEGSIQIDQNAAVINDGVLIAKVLKINGKFINNGTMEITKNGQGGNFDQLRNNASLMLSDNVSYFENNGYCSASTFYSVQSSKLINSCSLDIKFKMYCDGTSVELADGSLLKCEDFKGNNLKVDMYGSAVWKVTDDAIFVWNNNVTGHAVETSIPTIIFDDLDDENNTGKNAVTFYGPLRLVCMDDDELDEFDDYDHCTIKPGVIISTVPVVTVPPTNCNDDGVEEDPGTGTPSDPNFPIEVPLSTYYVFAMEDGWPTVGDYDMNDLVLGIKSAIYYQDKNNNVTSMFLNMDLRALGAINKLGAGVQFDKIAPSMIKSVTRNALHNISVSGYFTPSGNGVEGSSYAVIPFFDNAHAAFGVADGQITNTNKGSHVVVPGNITCDIVFTAPLPMENVNINALNFFIVNGGNSTARSEVHLAGRIPTEKVKSETNGYKSEDNMMWGFMIPDESYKYPFERVKITEAYPDFTEWCKSGGKQKLDWYKHPIDDKVFVE